MSSPPNLEDQVSGSMDGQTSEDRVHGSLGNLKPPLAELSTAPPSTAVFNTSTLGAFTPLSKDLGTDQNTALSYLLTYVTQGVTQTLKKEIDDTVRKQFNETLAARTPVKASAPVPGTSDSDNESPGSVAEIPEPKRPCTIAIARPGQRRLRVETHKAHIITRLAEQGPCLFWSWW